MIIEENFQTTWQKAKNFISKHKGKIAAGLGAAALAGAGYYAYKHGAFDGILGHKDNTKPDTSNSENEFLKKTAEVESSNKKNTVSADGKSIGQYQLGLHSGSAYLALKKLAENGNPKAQSLLKDFDSQGHFIGNEADKAKIAQVLDSSSAGLDAQKQVALEQYYKPAQKWAEAHHVTNEKSKLLIARLFYNMGPGGAQKALSALSPEELNDPHKIAEAAEKRYRYLAESNPEKYRKYLKGWINSIHKWMSS